MHATSSETAAAGRRPLTTERGLAPGPVLVATDGEDESSPVMRAASIITRHVGREAIVVSALDSLAERGWRRGVDPADPAARALAAARKDQLGREMAGGPAGWKLAIELGGAPRVLARVARDEDASVLVMGLGRHRPIDRLLGSDTVLRTLRYASCPVLAVPRDFAHMPARVVVGVDFSRTSAESLRTMVPFLARGASVHLVHVTPPVDLGDAKAVALEERQRAALPGRFRWLVQRAGIPDSVEVWNEVREGSPAEQLLGAAEAVRADLLVVGRHGEGWFDRLVVGRVAERVLRGATCAVLVVPEPVPVTGEPVAMLDGVAGVSHPRDTWTRVLDDVSRHNAGRLTVLETCDLGGGACSRESGYVLFGISYEPHSHEVEVILGEANGRRRHLTRVIPDAKAVVLFSDDRGPRAVRIEHGRGQTLLTLIS